MARFGGTSPRAEEWIREHAGRLITAITEDAREAVRDIIETGVNAGRNPRNVALDIAGRLNRASGRREGGVIGLSRPQADALRRARAELSNPDALRSYLSRKLRDKRYDPTVRRAIREGRALTVQEVDKLAGRYADRLLKHRAETIARTESLTALSAGREAGMAQMVESGKLRADQITRVWRTAGDARVRDTHGGMRGQAVGQGQPFVTPGGHRMMYPGDTSLGAPASETINCRCYVEHKVDRYTELE